MGEARKLPNDPQALKLLEECVKQGLSDKNIQIRLYQEVGYKWSLRTISRNRKKFNPSEGIKGSNGSAPFDRPALSVPPHGLNEHERAQWFRDQFKKSHLYFKLKTQLSKEEISGYIEEYGQLCCQFEDIVASEFFQVDDYLKHRILIDRQLAMIKLFQEDVVEIKEWIFKNPPQDEETRKDKDLRVEKYRQLQDATSALKHASDRYDRLAHEGQKIVQNLAATRKDRLEELKGGKENFFALVARLQASEKEREREGKYAELTRLAAEDVKKKFRQPVEFPDGSISPIIIDSKSDFGDNDE